MWSLVKLVVRNAEIAHPDGAFADPAEALWAAVRGLEVPFHHDVETGTVYLDSVVQGKTVVIDPAHGGRDRKERGPLGYAEAEGTLGIGKALTRLLRAAGARVVMTRAGDETISVEERLAAVRAEHPDLVISIHTGGVLAGGGLRPGVIWNHRRPWASFRLAGCLSRELSDYGGLPPVLRSVRWRGRDIEGYNALIIGSGAPAVVVECGCHRYPEQERLLMNQEYLERCARALYRGLCRYYGSELADHTSTTEELARSHGPREKPTAPSIREHAPEPTPGARPETVVAVPEPAERELPEAAAPSQPAIEPTPTPAPQATPAPGPQTTPAPAPQAPLPKPYAGQAAFGPALTYAGDRIVQVAPPGQVAVNIGVSDRAAEVMAGKIQDTGGPPMPPEFLHWPAPKPAGSPTRPHG